MYVLSDNRLYSSVRVIAHLYSWRSVLKICVSENIQGGGTWNMHVLRYTNLCLTFLCNPVSMFECGVNDRCWREMICAVVGPVVTMVAEEEEVEDLLEVAGYVVVMALLLVQHACQLWHRPQPSPCNPCILLQLLQVTPTGGLSWWLLALHRMRDRPMLWLINQ